MPDLRIIEQIVGQQVGPVGGLRIDGCHRLAQRLNLCGKILFGDSRDRIRIGDDTQTKRRWFIPQEIQDSRSARLEAVHMRIERPVQQDMTGAHAVAPEAAALLVSAGKNYGGVGPLVTVARNAAVSAPSLAALGDRGEAAHCLLVTIDELLV